MAELVPIPFQILLKRIYHEYSRNNSIFDLPSRKFYRPNPAVDTSVTFCGNQASNPLGPAAGPQTQLAQNIVLSWLAGSRILELKTIQVNDHLNLSRPCIDMATVGYNTEWSQELLLGDSLREYVKASMMVELLRQWLFDDQPVLNTVFDISVGYDLAGIQSRKVGEWLRVMQDASPIIEELRRKIPEEFASYRQLPFKSRIANSITLSTFHGTPADEIERICEYLLTEMDYHVIIKMNPPMLGKERVEYLLHEKLGYRDVEVNPKVYDVNISFSDAVDVVRRLQSVAARNGKHVGVKFGNTLEVMNSGSYLKDRVQFLSGQPLNVLHLALVEEWRRVFGADFPISFAAGVDANNFVDFVRIGLVPVTTCSDLLRPGGYGRLPQYLLNLERKMNSYGVTSIDEFIIASAQGGESEEKAGEAIGRLEIHRPKLAESILLNTSTVLQESIVNPRYHASSNRKSPRKIGSHLKLWDCINCDKCIPVCPNDANFFFEIEPLEIEYKNIEIKGSEWREINGGTFHVEETHQIATFADACNECGNCDVFCPEDGGPYIEKPRFFGSMESWKKWSALSGFVLLREGTNLALYGRFRDKEFRLALAEDQKTAAFHHEGIVIQIDWTTQKVVDVTVKGKSSNRILEMSFYHTMATLVKGMMDRNRVHFVNVGIMD